jgi:radical SAM superfamily enzyme YgiQ (UPF0313 family)
MSSDLSVHGRGALGNPGNRFETIYYDKEPDEVEDDDRPAPTTTFLKDTSRSLITTNDSPDVGFEASINPYRGCENGCIYCYQPPQNARKIPGKSLFRSPSC